MNEKPSAEVAAGVIGSRLVQALEEFLDSTSRRDEHLVKLLTVMAKLAASAQTPLPGGAAHLEAADVSGVVAALEKIAERSVPAGSTAVQAPVPDITAVLEKQNQTNELLVRLITEQARRVSEAEMKQIPELSDQERWADLQIGSFDDKDIAFMKESEVFGALSDETLKVIRANATLEKYEPGKMIFVIGDPVSQVYIIKSGIVEICRPTDDPDKLNVVAYLTAGDSIGEMSILISGDSRSSIARVPQGAEVLMIPHDVFMKLFKALPELALRLATVFARRLKTSIKKERIQTHHRELQGSLEYFDLATIIQTLLSSDERTGVLTVTDEQQEPVADLYFEAGTMRYARYRQLLGEEAFYQLFQTENKKGSFSFKEGKFPEGFDQRAEVSVPGMSLLFEAARLSDELKLLKEQIPDPDKVFKPKVDALEWTDDDNRTLANGIWNMLRRGASVTELTENLPRSEYAIYAVLAEMLKSGQIE